MHCVPLLRSWPIHLCITTHVATWKKVHEGCLWSVATGHQIDLLFKVRNTNHHCLFSLWKMCSALFRAYPDVSTCLTVITEWHFFDNGKKYWWNPSLVYGLRFWGVVWLILSWFVCCWGFFFVFNYATWLKHSREKRYCTYVSLGVHLNHAGSCRQTKLALPALSLGRPGRLQASLCLKAA